MRSDKKNSSRELREARISKIDRRGKDKAERVHNSVSGENDTRTWYAFGAKVGSGTRGRHEIQVGEWRNEMPVHLFRKRAVLVAGSEAGFDVPDEDFLLKGNEGRGKGRCGVTLNQEPVRPNFSQDSRKGFKNAGGEFQRSLIFLHEIQIVVWGDVKDTQHLVQHVPMLCRDADVHFDVCSPSGANNWRHFYGFGTRAENGDDAHELSLVGRAEQRVRNAI